MLLYIILLLVITSLFLLVKTNRIQDKTAAVCIFSFVFVLLAFRAVTVGEDTQMYLDVANASTKMQWSDLFRPWSSIIWKENEWGFGPSIDATFLLLAKILMSITGYPRSLILFCSAVICLGFYRFYLANSEDQNSLFIAIFLFVCSGLFMSSFNLMRQMFALAIGIQFYEHEKDGRYVPSLMYIFIGTLFHRSCLVLLCLFIMHILIQRRAFFITVTILGLLVPIFIPIFGFITSFISPQYARYFEFNVWENSIGGNTVVLAFYMVYIILYIKKCLTVNQQVNELCSFTAIYIGLSIASYQVSMLDRVSLYCLPFATLFISKTMNSESCIPFLSASIPLPFRKEGVEPIASNGLLKKKLTVYDVYNILFLLVMLALYFSYAKSPVRLYQFGL